MQTIIQRMQKQYCRIMNVVSSSYYDDCNLHLHDEGILNGDPLYFSVFLLIACITSV